MQSVVRWAGKLVTCGTVGNLPFVCACRFPSTNTCKREVTHTLSTFTNTFLHGYVVWVRRARWGKATHNFMAARTVNLPLQQIQVVGRGQNGHGHVLKQDSNRSQQHSFVRRRAVGIFHVSARVEPELVMLEMSNPLQDDLIAFNSTAEANSPEITKEAIAEESDAHASEPNELTPSSTEVSVCEICNRQFLKKKDLRSHFLVHVGQPRVVLNRIPNRKPAKKHVTDTYRLDPEKKGSLKLTLKKQGSTDSLKLTLKKSSISQDFAVVNTNLDSENYQRNDVAGSGTNDSKDTSNTENDADEPFENVTINQQSYENNDYKTDERTDPLQDRDRPPFMDINEGDSGVGSDTVNAPEREDQAIEDQPSIDGLGNSEKVLPEIDDHEESDAIEATCREAIENLKKLGEDTRTVDPLADTGLPIEANTDETTAMIQQLTENSSISIIPKSSICPIPSPKPNSAHEIQGEASQSPKSNPDFNWNELSSDLSNRNTENTDKQGEQTVDQADPHTGSLLQNFLMEHHRRNENETSLSSNLPPGETEYVSLERAPRIPSQAGQAVPRQRLKRSAQLVAPPPQHQQMHAASKQRRMDVLVPDRNEDADCHIIAQQKRNDGLPVIQSVQGAVQPSVRNDSTIHLTDSITLSVRQPAQTGNSSSPTGKKSDAKAVANVLAARGITVTPAASKNKSSEQGKQLPQPQLRAPPSPSQAVNVTSLNLNSAISIIPATSQRKQQEQQGQFAVPQTRPSKQLTSDVDRPPRPPTVDLTQDTPQPLHHMTRRGRPSKAMLTCQVCDKIFQNQEMLTQHMATHQTPSKLLHKCHQCPAQYPTAQALAQHIQTYHKETETMLQNGGAELALPVVDLKSHQVLNRLSSLGIQSYIPLSQLSAQTGGYFGLPIVTRDGVRNSSICNLAALGANSVLSLGPLKYLPPR
ncbi:uncharacterized protein LOC107216631 isoform X4 [Neodiprion lecontei]|uniref:Uncharacterized protein LOC107216631 isoform X4 n=2 Tax=Neodiprion TaxID=270857 RepID=A0ABM3FTY7_NEOLC|nr:uncharacterized protein LOC107216631 isoform X4 [Neodiprion lecontei]